MAKEIGLSQPTKSNSTPVDLPFDPSEFPRETPQHYISANEKDLNEMLSTVGLGDLSQLFGHIDPTLLFPDPLSLPEEKGYFDVADNISAISNLSNRKANEQ